MIGGSTHMLGPKKLLDPLHGRLAPKGLSNATGEEFCDRSPQAT
jgi:hypothetical protein